MAMNVKVVSTLDNDVNDIRMAQRRSLTRKYYRMRPICGA